MITYITVWIKSIIFVVLFAAFFELLLPNTSMQRFVRVILGLFIMLSVLNPVIDTMEHQLTMSAQLPVLASKQQDNHHILLATDTAVQKREQLIRDLYVKDLARQVRATVIAINGVADANIAITTETAAQQPGKEPGKIKTIIVYIKPSTGSLTAPETTQQSNRLPVAVIDKVTRTVSELYQLNVSQIEVTWMN